MTSQDDADRRNRGYQGYSTTVSAPHTPQPDGSGRLGSGGLNDPARTLPHPTPTPNGSSHVEAQRRFERWRHEVLAAVYRAGIHAFPNPLILQDPNVPTLELFMIGVPVLRVDDIPILMAIIREKLVTALSNAGASRGALLIDISGIMPSQEIRGAWAMQLRPIFAQTLIESYPGQGDFLLARYSTQRGVVKETQTGGPTMEENLKRIHILTETTRAQMTANVCDSRNEAIALLQARYHDWRFRTGLL